MQVIQHTELTGSAAYIEFTSIPSTFTDLYLVCSLRGDSGAVYGIHYLRFNGSTSGYSGRYLEGSGSSAYSGTYTFGAYLGASTGSTSTANTFSNLSAYIPNYASSNAKSVSLDGVGENNGTQAFQDINAALWTGTDPISSIRILNDSSQNLLQYSSATLYGITKGSDGVTTVS